MNKKSIKTTITIIIFAAGAFLLLDIFGIPSHFGIRLNVGAWNVFVVIALFAITYVAIDSHDITRKQNQEEVAKVLLLSTYSEVRSYVKMMEADLFDKAIPKVIDGGIMLPQSKAYQNLSKTPFAFEERIFRLADEGIISAEELSGYIAVKQHYERYVTNRIVFKDVSEINDVVKKNLMDALDTAENIPSESQIMY